jgi:hypothetical protein
MRSSDFQSGQQRTMLFVGGVIVLALIGIGMIWVGFRLDRAGRSDNQPSPTATSALPAVQPPGGGVAIVPTSTPLPTATPPPPTDTPQPTPVPEPMVVAQEGGVNVRSGPGMGFSTVGRLEGGASARVTGKYADWWQIDYGGTQAWVANWVVTDSNTGGVPDVVPPASPIPATSVPPTPIPATAGPTAVPATAVPDTRGLQANHFSVGLKEKKKESVNPQSAYGNIGDVWFCFEAVNAGAGEVTLSEFGAWAKENGHFQVSWGGGEGPFTVPAGGAVGQTRWCDHFYNDKDPEFPQGTYHIYLRACFTDGYCVNLAGPIAVNIG